MRVEGERVTRRQLFRAGGALAGAVLLAACTPPAAPGSVQDSGVSTLVPPQSPQRLDSSSPVSEIATMSPQASLSPQAKEFAQQSILLVNQARGAAGLEPLTESPLLSEVAQAYSLRMATEGFYGHEDPQGKKASDRIAAAGYLAQMSAENIASGQPDAQTVVEGWLNSPGHRANIMNPDFREIGAGYAYTSTPPYHHYWTHLFATPDASVGRDQARYPEEALAQINELRQQAGAAPLVTDPTLAGIAAAHMDALLQSHADRSQIEQILNAASGEAVQSFRQAVALSAAGPATPEDVVAQWAESNGSSTFIDGNLTVAGVAYRFVEQDEYRHYWLLLLAS